MIGVEPFYFYNTLIIRYLKLKTKILKTQLFTNQKVLLIILLPFSGRSGWGRRI